MNRWLLLNSGKCDPAFNMALDEALLEAMTRLQAPVLRFYGWMEPAASFGYFQKFAEVEQATLLRPLVRRPTGGGIVPHNADWTYSFAVPPDHEWHSLPAIESYRRMHDWIRQGFEKLKIQTELATDKKAGRGESDSASPGECFTGHEKFDVLWRGRKIAGAAQRRNKLGLLIQGSVQPPPIIVARADWERGMCAVAAGSFSIEWSPFSPDNDLLARTAELARQKYFRSDYNRKR